MHRRCYSLRFLMLLTGLVGLLLAGAVVADEVVKAFSDPVLEQARVFASKQRLIEPGDSCTYFEKTLETADFVHVEMRRMADADCAGDPDTLPPLFLLLVSKPDLEVTIIDF